jgi:TetR/AcrR family transcriptional regulator
MNKMEDIKDSRTKILLAARKVFVEKGKDGARMEQIAETAGVNKAMLHYYFTSKDLLYEEVFRDVFTTIFPMILSIINSTDRFRHKIERMIEEYIRFLSDNPEFPRLMGSELGRGGTTLKKIMSEPQLQSILQRELPFISMIKQGVAKKEIKQVDATQTIVSLMGLIIFPFLARPLLESFLPIPQKDYASFLAERKKHIIKILDGGIFP